MLALTMRQNGGDHVVHFIDNETGQKIGQINLIHIGQGQVKLGFEFPEWVGIQRDVVFKREQRR